MLFHQRDEIRRRVAGQRRLGKVRIAGNKTLRSAMNVGEITSSSAGNEDLLSRALGAFEDGHAPPSFAGFYRAHEPGSSRAENYRIIVVGVK